MMVKYDDEYDVRLGTLVKHSKMSVDDDDILKETQITTKEMVKKTHLMLCVVMLKNTRAMSNL
jgi:hypothetical protein